MKKYYKAIADIHLHTGLFISPFILIFSVSALVLNHNFIDWQEDWQNGSFRLMKQLIGLSRLLFQAMTKAKLTMQMIFCCN